MRVFAFVSLASLVAAAAVPAPAQNLNAPRDLGSLLTTLLTDTVSIINNGGSVTTTVENLIGQLGTLLGINSVGKRDLGERDLGNVVTTLLTDTVNLINGGGSATTLAEDLIGKLGTTIGINPNNDKRDIHEKRDLNTLVSTALTDATAIVNGKGTIVQFTNDLVANLEALLGLPNTGPYLNPGGTTKRSPGAVSDIAKRDLTTLVNQALQDAEAIISGSGNVVQFTNHLVANLEALLGLPNTGPYLNPGGTATTTKRSPQLLGIDLNPSDLPVLQDVQGLLQNIQTIVSSAGVTAEVQALITELEAVLSSLGINVNINLADVTNTVASLLNQVASIIQSL